MTARGGGTSVLGWLRGGDLAIFILWLIEDIIFVCFIAIVIC